MSQNNEGSYGVRSGFLCPSAKQRDIHRHFLVLPDFYGIRAPTFMIYNRIHIKMPYERNLLGMGGGLQYVEVWTLHPFI